MLMPLASHEWKSYVALHFIHDLRNAVVPLMKPWASCTNTIPGAVTWPKMSCCMSFWVCWPKECIVPLMMLSPLHDADTNTGATRPKTSCYTSFQLSKPKECNGTIDDAFGIMWQHLCHCQWHQITKKSFCTIFELSWEIQWCHWQHYWNHMMPVLVPKVWHEQAVMLYLILSILT